MSDTGTSGLSVADTTDRHTGLAALGGLALGLKFAADAGMHFVGPEWARILDAIGVGLGLVAVLLIAPAVLWKIRHRDAHQRRVYFSDQTFTATALRKAHVASWAATVFVLLVFEFVSKDLPRLPSEFFVQSALAVMFGSLSVSFLILDREAGGSGSDA